MLAWSTYIAFLPCLSAALLDVDRNLARIEVSDRAAFAGNESSVIHLARKLNLLKAEDVTHSSQATSLTIESEPAKESLISSLFEMMHSGKDDVEANENTTSGWKEVKGAIGCHTQKCVGGNADPTMRNCGYRQGGRQSIDEAKRHCANVKWANGLSCWGFAQHNGGIQFYDCCATSRSLPARSDSDCTGPDGLTSNYAWKTWIRTPIPSSCPRSCTKDGWKNWITTSTTTTTTVTTTKIMRSSCRVVSIVGLAYAFILAMCLLS